MLVVLDTETTGLEPTKAHLLELALVVVDDNLTALTQVSYIWPNDTPVQDLISESNDNVKNMHMASGLWPDVHAEQQARWSAEQPGAREARAVYGKILAELYRGLAHYGIASNSKATMVGRNPGFDLGFLKVHAPELAVLFGHQMVDVCSFQLRSKKPRWPVEQTHRALADCLNEIDELKYYEAP